MKNILNNFTIRSLKLNKKRTIATSIGIILSTALICAVAGVFASFQETLVTHAKQADGDYHVMFNDVKKDEQKYVINNRNVKSTFITQGVGYARLEDIKNEYKPYLYLMEFDETAINNMGLVLEEGRMPENSNELVIPKHLEDNGGVILNVGDTITLNVGKRVAGGNALGQNNPYNNPKDAEDEDYVEEKIVDTQTRTFTIVGIIKRPNTEIEDFSSPGYTVITKLSEVRENANIMVKYKNIKDTYKNTEEILKETSIENYQVNSEYLRWNGVTKSDSTLQMFYSLAGIVIAIIIISSVFVIRNSFAISITEKMKQYGMFSSIGATKKQIKKSVLFEGLMIGIISVPIGILCGMLATFILIKMTTFLVGESLFTVKTEIVFKMPIIVVILSAILGFLTIYISCIFSARKASKIAPIEAIRSNENIKIKAKKIKSPKWVKKIFGIGGDIAYKNLKRNRKKYRTTVISLVVSITVFISLSSFIHYAFNISDDYYTEMNYNVVINLDYNNSYYSQKYSREYHEKNFQYAQNLIKKYQIEEYTINRVFYGSTNLKKYATEEYKSTGELELETDKTYIGIKSLGEKEYKNYVKEIGANYEDCKNGIIYYDNAVSYTSINGNITKCKKYKISRNDKIDLETDNGDKVSLEVKKVTDKRPMGETQFSVYGVFIISDELMDKMPSFYCDTIKVNSTDATKLCKDLDEEISNLPKDSDYKLSYFNYQQEAEENNKIVLLISIFLYGFIIVISLIGVTNIFNTITTNMNLRSKEFAMLRSIGMTKKEFNKMINLESFFYGTKSLLIGCILGTGLSYWIYRITSEGLIASDVKFTFPIKSIIISIVFISIIVSIILRYSLSKINKQNIIETIRNDNI